MHKKEQVTRYEYAERYQQCSKDIPAETITPDHKNIDDDQ